jgi:hypothetical protein
LSFQVGVRKGAPGAFGDEDVVGLLMQFGDQFTEVGGKLPMPSRRLCPPRSSPRDVNQNYRQLLLAKGFDKLTGIVDDTCYGMERRYVPKALLKIHHDQRSLRVKDGEWRNSPLKVANEVWMGRFAAGRSVLSNLREQVYG